MEKKKKQNKITTILMFALMLFSCLFSCFNFSNIAYAYEPPLPDYPHIDNYGLYFQNLTEENESVYIYINQYYYENTVYASSINISINLEKLDFKNYKLEFLSIENDNPEYGNLYSYKYKVKDLAIKSNNKRVYEITSIYRPYFGYADGYYPEGSNIPTEIAFQVERCYTFLTNEDGTTTMSVLATETIYITEKFVGFVRYNGGYGIYADVDCDSHFVAFNTDKDIDRLIEADVYYTTQSYKGDSFNHYGTKEDCYAYLKASKKISYKGDNFFANNYEWNEIQTIDEFFDSVDVDKTYSISSFDSGNESLINDETKAQLQDKQWVLRFATTEYMSIYVPDMGTFNRRTIVGDVSILRLKFETGGTTFEYGAIDDKTTGSSNPVVSVGSTSFLGGISDIFGSIGDWFKGLFGNIGKVILIIIAIALLIFFFPLILSWLPAILSAVIKIFKAVIDFIIWLIKLPIKIFKRD